MIILQNSLLIMEEWVLYKFVGRCIKGCVGNEIRWPNNTVNMLNNLNSNKFK